MQHIWQRLLKFASTSSVKVRGLLVVVLIAAVGSILLFQTKAANTAADIEPEGGVTSGAVVVSDASASKGKAIKFNNFDIATATKPLPFDMPSTQSLRSSPRLVFAHYWPPMPISLDNKSSDVDYFTRNYLTVDGESGKHAAYGGYLRSRPLPRAPYLNMTTDQWRLEDMKTEVRRAIAAGLDGFTLDIIISNPASTDQITYKSPFYLLQAAQQVDPGFKIMLMPDMSGTGMSNNTTQQFADLTAQWAAYPSAMRLGDGRLVISPFKAEAHPPDWWVEYMNIMKTQYGITIALVPCFVNSYLTDLIPNTSTTYANGFAPISYGFSNWGSRNPAYNSNTNLAKYINDAHTRNLIWMQPVSLQDERPNQGKFDEANNTENLRQTWNAAFQNGITTQGAEWVQIPTWNDYSEETNIAPSTATGWSPLDLISYHIVRYKTGSFPAIKRDVLYVSHRVQFWDAPTTYNETKLMVLRGGTPARDTVEIASSLAGPATITVKVGTNTYTYDAPAGFSTKTYPLAVGTISASAVRSGKQTANVTSPFPVVANPYVQNLHYHFVGSSRDGVQ